MATIRLTWGFTTGAVEYRIYHGEEPGLSIYRTPVLGTTDELFFEHEGLETGTTHYYIVVGVGPNGEIGAPTDEIEKTVEARQLLSVIVEPEDEEFDWNDTQQYVAIGVYNFGPNEEITEGVVWSSGDEAVMAIDEDGLATANPPGGTSVITATYGDFIGVTNAFVQQLEIIGILPDEATISVDETQQYTATGYFNFGDELDITDLVEWNTEDSEIATIDGSGLLTGLTIGTTAIFADLYEASGATLVMVSEVAPTLEFVVISCAEEVSAQLLATGHYSDTSVEDITTEVVWASSNTDVATIDEFGFTEAQGIIGTSLITATLGEVVGYHTLLAQDTQWAPVFTGLGETAPEGTVINYAKLFITPSISDFPVIYILNSDSDNVESGKNGIVVLFDALTDYWPIDGDPNTTFPSSGEPGTATNVLPYSMYARDMEHLWVSYKKADASTYSVYRLHPGEVEKQWSTGNVQTSVVGEQLPIAIHEGAFVVPAGEFSNVYYSGDIWSSGNAALYRNFASNDTWSLLGGAPDLSASSTSFGAIHSFYQVDNIGEMDELQIQITWFGSYDGTLLKNELVFPDLITTDMSSKIGSSIGNSNYQILDIWSASVSITYVAVYNVEDNCVYIWRTDDAGDNFDVVYTSDVGYSKVRMWGFSWERYEEEAPELVWASFSGAGKLSKMFNSNGGMIWTEQYMPAVFTNTQSAVSLSVIDVAVSPVLASSDTLYYRPYDDIGVMGCISELFVSSGGITEVHFEQQIQMDVMIGTEPFFEYLHPALVSWSTSDPDKATIDGYGLLTCLSFGGSPFTVYATIGDDEVIGEYELGIASLVSINVEPENDFVQVNGTLQFTATGIFSDSSMLDITGMASWFSSNPSIVEIDETGLATGIADGEVDITASLNAVEGTTSLTAYVNVFWMDAGRIGDSMGVDLTYSGTAIDDTHIYFAGNNEDGYAAAMMWDGYNGSYIYTSEVEGTFGVLWATDGIIVIAESNFSDPPGFGAIKRSLDGGEIFTALEIPVPFYYVPFVWGYDDQHFFVSVLDIEVIAYNYFTSDGGETFELIEIPDIFFITAMAGNGPDDLWVIDAFFNVFAHFDGDAWTTIPYSNPDSLVQNIWVSGIPGEAYITVYNEVDRIILHITDYTNIAEEPVEPSYEGEVGIIGGIISGTNPNRIWATFGVGYIMFRDSIDESWYLEGVDTEVEEPAIAGITMVPNSPNQYGLAAAYGGYLFKHAPPVFYEWRYLQRVGTNDNLDILSSFWLDDENVFVGGTASSLPVLLKYNGSTATTLFTGLGGGSVSTIWGASIDVLWIGGYFGYFAKSTDGGTTFTSQTPPGGFSDPTSIWGWDANNFYVAKNDTPALWFTSNGGATFDEITLPGSPGAIYSIAGNSQFDIWVVGPNSYIATFDGDSWTNRTYETSGITFNKVWLTGIGGEAYVAGWDDEWTSKILHIGAYIFPGEEDMFTNEVYDGDRAYDIGGIDEERIWAAAGDARVRFKDMDNNTFELGYIVDEQEGKSIRTLTMKLGERKGIAAANGGYIFIYGPGETGEP